MADDRVIVIDMAKDQAGANIAQAKAEGVKELPLFGGIVQTSNNSVWYQTIQDWKAVGLPVSTYWWPGWGSPEAEADEAVARHQQAGATGGIALDCEGDVPAGVNAPDWITRFLARVQAHGIRPIEYSTRGWLAQEGAVEPDKNDEWVAAYGDDSTDPDVPNPDDRAALWQYTQHGRAPGFGGDVDLSVGHRDQVAALFGAAPNSTEELSVSAEQNIIARIDQLESDVGKWFNHEETNDGSVISQLSVQIAALRADLDAQANAIKGGEMVLPGEIVKQIVDAIKAGKTA